MKGDRKQKEDTVVNISIATWKGTRKRHQD